MRRLLFVVPPARPVCLHTWVLTMAFLNPLLRLLAPRLRGWGIEGGELFACPLCLFNLDRAGVRTEHVF